MNKVVVLAAAMLAACSHKQPEPCSSIDKLVSRNPVADAESALAKGDRHLLSLGGFAPTVPGVSDDVAINAADAVELEGTTDTTTEACYRIRHVAEQYASKYNQTIMRAPR
jgi:hypothetical protein